MRSVDYSEPMLSISRAELLFKSNVRRNSLVYKYPMFLKMLRSETNGFCKESCQEQGAAGAEADCEA